MNLLLDGEGPTYQQLARALRQAIRQRRLPLGTRLPPSRELCVGLGVSRNTVVAAYELLRAEGVIAGKVGSGSYVLSSRGDVSTRGAASLHALPQSAFSQQARHQAPLRGDQGVSNAEPRHFVRQGKQLFDPALASRWSNALVRAARHVRPDPMQGFPPLQEAVCRHIRLRRGVICEPEDILIVHGAQQAFALVARVLVDPGDFVLIEDPHDPALRRLLEAHGACLRPLPVDDAGMQVAALATELAKLVFVTPASHYPTGAVLSSERRRDLLAYARAHDCWVCEDDTDADLHHGRAVPPALQSLDRDGRVVYLGAFPRMLFPGLRLGYIVMPRALRRDLLVAKCTEDGGNGCLEQVALTQVMTSGAYERRLRAIRRQLASKQALLQRLLVDAAGQRIILQPSNGGLHVVIRIPDVPAAAGPAMVDIARSRGLTLLRLDECYLDPPLCAGFLLDFGGIPDPELPRVAALFAACLAQCCPAPGLSRMPEPRSSSAAPHGPTARHPPAELCPSLSPPCLARS